MKLGKDFLPWAQLIMGIIQLFMEIFGDEADKPKNKVH